MATLSHGARYGISAMRRHRYCIGAALTMCGLALASCAPQPTLAAFQDIGHAAATVTAQWEPKVYARNSFSSARSTSNDGNLMYDNGLYAQERGNLLAEDLTAPDIAHVGPGYYCSGDCTDPVSSSDWSNITAAAVQGLPRDPWADRLHNWDDKGERIYNIDNEAIIPVQRCEVINTSYHVTATNDSRCGLGSGNIAAARTRVKFYGFSVDPSILADESLLKTHRLQTAVRCSATAAFADAPTGLITIEQEAQSTSPEDVWGDGTNFRTLYTGGVVNTGWQPASATLIASNHSIQYRVVASTTQTNNPPYAKSEVVLFMTHYEGGSWKTDITFVLARSECGVYISGVGPTTREDFPAFS